MCVGNIPGKMSISVANTILNTYYVIMPTLVLQLNTPILNTLSL